MKEELLLKQKEIESNYDDIDNLKKKLEKALDSVKEMERLEKAEKQKKELEEIIENLKTSLENKDKEMTDIKNQQIELKRVELITFQRNIEDKYKLEIEQLKEENKNKISVIRRKNDANLQKALAQQKRRIRICYC